MAMPVVVPRYTLADLDSFPDDGNRYELLDGILLVSPGPAPLHEVVVGRLLWALNRYLPPQLATVFPRGTVELEPNNHLEPDILVIPADEPEGGIGRETRWTAVRRWWLAVEVSGGGSRVYDRDHKVPAYVALGVREVWRVDLDDRCVYVSRRDLEQPHPERLVWHPPEQPEPLVLEVTALFEREPS
jgi:Uma2 family endonuclease